MCIRDRLDGDAAGRQAAKALQDDLYQGSKDLVLTVNEFTAVSYTHLTLPTSDLV